MQGIYHKKYPYPYLYGQYAIHIWGVSRPIDAAYRNICGRMAGLEEIGFYIHMYSVNVILATRMICEFLWVHLWQYAAYNT